MLLPQNPPKLDAKYIHYIQRKLKNGWISDRAAVMAIRARRPSATAADIRKMLGQ